MDVVTSTRPRGAIDRLFGPRALPRWAVASLVANIGIVVTGGVVRLTASGLGCPTWPRCTTESYVTHPALGVHGVIEFGNRLLTFVLIIIAVGTFLAALRARGTSRARRDLRLLAGGLALGIPLQGVIGGISVLTRLNPYVVGLHFLLSMGLIGGSVWLVRRTRLVRTLAGRRGAVALARLSFAAFVVAIVLGVLVTGSGPHAGDLDAVRNGLDSLLLSHLHAGAVYTGIAGTVAVWWLTRSRAAVLALAVSMVQAAIGIAQFNLGLPIGLVALHLLGASLTMAAATNLLLAVRPQVSASTSQNAQQTPAPNVYAER